MSLTRSRLLLTQRAKSNQSNAAYRAEILALHRSIEIRFSAICFDIVMRYVLPEQGINNLWHAKTDGGNFDGTV